MKRFLFKIFLFCIPIAVILAIPLVVFIVAREFINLNVVIATQQQSSEEILFNFTYNNYTKKYKSLTTAVIDPEIVTLGTSRAMQYRSTFFKDENLFYNASGQDNTSDLVQFLLDLPESSRPEVIIVGIDARYLQLKPAQSVSVTEYNRFDQIKTFFNNGWRVAYLDYFKGKYGLRELFLQRKVSENFGLTALIRNSGARKDGSFKYPANSQRLIETREQILSWKEKINSGEGDLGYDDTVSAEHLSDIDEFLSLASSKNIYVIGYISPLPKTLSDTMASLPDARGNTYRSLPYDLQTMFKKYGFNFYNTQDLDTFNGSDDEFLDYEHGSEKLMSQLLGYLTENEELLKKFVDVEAVRMLQHANQ